MDAVAYRPPGRVSTRFNRLVGWLANRGVSLVGARTLEVVGRTSGRPRTTPVNPLRLDGRTYVLGARGHTHWTRNLRAAGTCTLRRGRSVVAYRATELADADKIPVLREYLRKWEWEVGAIMPVSISKSSTDAELLAAAPALPVFELHRA
jgi:deazaflavin-dependent oxidoreductase (nitroreductase family)